MSDSNKKIPGPNGLGCVQPVRLAGLQRGWVESPILIASEGEAIQGDVGRPKIPGSPRRFAPRENDSIRRITLKPSSTLDPANIEMYTTDTEIRK
jgi:hypothetical protein